MKFILLFAFTAFFTLNSFSQEEIVVIDKYQYKEGKKEKVIKLNDNTQVFKFAPLNMVVGEISFGYEKQLSKQVSLDMEVGPTFSKLVLSVVADGGNSSNPGVYQYSGIGFHSSVGLRLYPSDDTEALNRFYVSPIMKFKTYNYGIEDISGILEDSRGSSTIFNFYFNFGYQLWASKSFALDFYGGMGLGYQQVVDYITESIFENNEWTYSWRKETGTGTRFVANLGIKVGFGQP